MQILGLHPSETLTSKSEGAGKVLTNKSSPLNPPKKVMLLEVAPAHLKGSGNCSQGQGSTADFFFFFCTAARSLQDLSSPSRN